MLQLICLLLGPAVIGSAAAAEPQRSGSTINVILWFDTEDYLLPADDDATKRLCEMLTARGIRATFKIVGEKARVLERRGRQDVIAALRHHDIGYHANFHSVHPTPAEYLADCGWNDGIAEFSRREGGGAADVRRILHVKTLACYGQPGSSWAPQAIAALGRIGIAPHGVPCYLDEGTHVGIDNQPFWFCGALNVYHMGPNYTRMELHDPSAVEPAERKVSEIAERLRKQGGGLISIFYHPCEWVHREFWDSVNFARGANPPREQWKPPRQRPAEETEAAFRRFGEYIDYIRQISGVRWVTASELPAIYPDRARTKGVTAAELAGMARRIVEAKDSGLDIQRIGDRVFSVADQFQLLAVAMNEVVIGRKPRFPLMPAGILGPEAVPPPGGRLTNLTWFAFRDAVRDVRDFIAAEGHVPARVFVGADAVPPADFLFAMAAAWSCCGERDKLPLEGRVPLARGVRLLPERYVAEDSPELFGGWIIHKADFRAPKLMELARLQAWTLKPAIQQPQ